MKTFYSLIKIVPNELSGDSLTIGIVLSSAEGFKVRFSKLKKNMAKSMTVIDSSLIDFVEREIITKLKEQNSLISSNKSSLFDLPSELDIDYFSYLSKYSNGLLKFSTPNIIADDVDDVKFSRLFKLFVDSSEDDNVLKDDSIKKYEKAFYSKVNTNLISKVKNRVHINETLNNKIVPSLFNPFLIDCIGLNGVLIGAKSLPFTQSKETLHKSLNTYVSVIAHLSSTHNKSLDQNKFYLIADQPDKKTPVYKLWKELYQNDRLVTVISSDESGKVAEIIIESGATTFF